MAVSGLYKASFLMLLNSIILSVFIVLLLVLFQSSINIFTIKILL